MKGKRIALLIDSENISAKYMPIISEELEKQGTVTYKRIYGDWANSQTVKWREKVLEYSLTPIQQFRNTVGKNAIDSALIIDAMDILYTDRVDGFCIVSSDSDFTRLANRLRESGMLVIGMGEEKSPNSFRVACSVFVNLQRIEEQKRKQDLLAMETLRLAEEEIAIGRGQINESEIVGKDTSNEEKDVRIEQEIGGNTLRRGKEKRDKRKIRLVDKKDIEQEILAMIMNNESKGKVTELGEVGSRLSERYPSFNVRHYGCSGLARFLEDMSSIRMVKINTRVTLRIREESDQDEKIYNYIKYLLAQSKARGIELGTLGRNIHSEYEQFNVKDFGYTKLSHFIQNIDGIEIREERNKKNTKQIVYLQI